LNPSSYQVHGLKPLLGSTPSLVLTLLPDPTTIAIMKAPTTLLFALITSVLAVPAPAAAPAPAELAPRAGEYLGGVAMDKACIAQYGYLAFSERRGNGCSDWSCALLNFQARNLPIDVPAQCKRQYGNGVYAYCTTGWAGWGCYRA